MKTSDLGLATTLLTLGYDLVNIDATDSKRIFFLFSNVSEDVQNNYFMGKITIDPVRFMGSMKYLKRKIYNIKDSVGIYK